MFKHFKESTGVSHYLRKVTVQLFNLYVIYSHCTYSSSLLAFHFVFSTESIIVYIAHYICFFCLR